jgi:DNA-binding Lrp family transcriptional regulator
VKSEDVLVLMKLAAAGRADATVRELEHDLGISRSVVSKSLRRLEAEGLLQRDGSNRRVNRLALKDFIAHGVRWVAPARVGEFELGLPTAHAGPSLAGKLRGDDEPVVMPLAHGPVRGRAVSPIHPKAPAAANRDPKLYRLLAIVDAFRIGRARDREVAAEELRAWL